MTLRVKVCGLTRPEDAVQAAELGASLLGLIFVPGTPRVVSVAQAQAFAEALSGRVPLVGVFRNAPLETILEAVAAVPLAAVQFHGQEPSEWVELVPVPAYPVLPLTWAGPSPRALAAPYAGRVPAVLFDRDKDAPQADWASLAAERLSAEPPDMPWILAGGLTAETVAAVLAPLRTVPGLWGVDVASGVEAAPGVKSPERLGAFFSAVQGVSG